MLQYVNFADNEILPAVCGWVFPTLGVMPQDQKVGSCDVCLAVMSLIRNYITNKIGRVNKGTLVYG